MSQNPTPRRTWVFAAIAAIVGIIALVVSSSYYFMFSPAANSAMNQKIENLTNSVTVTNQELENLKKTEESIQLSDFAPNLLYYFAPLKLQNMFGGYQFDMLVTNVGKYNQNVTNTWWVSRMCSQNNTEIDLPNPEKTVSGWVIAKGDDLPVFLQVYKIFPQLQPGKSFELGLFVQSQPALTTEIVKEISKTRKTFVQYDYNNQLQTWVPRFNNRVLDCGYNSSSYSGVVLDANNVTQFLEIHN